MERSYHTLKVILIVILISAVVSNMMAQVRIVGIVSDENNKPIESVEVSCPDASKIVQTNSIGEYSLEVSADCKKLLFTFKEHVVTEKIENRSIINVQLIEKVSIITTRDYRYNIMLNAGGAIVWGSISGSLMVTNFISLDLGLGLGKIYGGATAYFNSPFRNNNWQPYVGINMAYFEEFMGPTSSLIYVPVGLRYLNTKGTSISFETGFLGSNNDDFLLQTPIWGGIRFGKYF